MLGSSFPAHGRGHAAVEGGAEGLARDRVHDYFHHLLADRRVHSGAAEMGGIVGRMFREFAVRRGVAIILSGFVSLTLTPMLCARAARTDHEGEKRILRVALVRGDVQRACCVATNWRSTGFGLQMSSLLVTFAADHRNVLLLLLHSQRLFPDRGYRLHLSVRWRSQFRHLFPGDPGSRTKIASIVQADKAVDYVNSTVGVGGRTSPTTRVTLFIALKPRDERKERLLDVIERLRPNANVVTGMRAVFAPVRTSNITRKDIEEPSWQIYPAVERCRGRSIGLAGNA